VDRLARLIAPHRAETSNPVTVTEEAGGGAFNAARALRRHGVEVAFLSARGADAGGALVEAAMAAAGIVDLAGVHLDRATPSYTALLEPGGELVTAMADMALHEAAFPKGLHRAPVRRAAASAEAFLCDANILPAALAAVVEMAAGRPVFALAISAGKVSRLQAVLPHLAALFLNKHESAVLTGLDAAAPASVHAAALAGLGLRRAVVTAGGGAAAVLDAGRVTRLEPPAVEIVDVTGAGDALAGETIARLLSGSGFAEAATHGMAAAALTAARAGASPAIAVSEIDALAKTIPAPAPGADA
jgi:sugar/nucleoside kinase (ribokinase family)